MRADIVRFVGDQIALVAAKTEDAAASARDLIEIEFEDLLVVADPITAMRPESPLIHPERGDSNVCVHYKIRKGAIVAGLAQADVVVESQYHLPFQEHTYLQPEAGLAYIDEEGCVMVQRGGQWPHADRAQIAHALGLPEEQILLPWHCTVWWMAWLWRLVLAFRADWDWRRLLPSSSTRSRRGFQ